jgi:glycosyltransferase involved in cell wall biosynthesis
MKENVVQVVTTLNRGGLETLLLNTFRNLNNNYKYIFLVHKRGSHHYFSDVKSLGGEIIGIYREGFIDYLMYPFRLFFHLRAINSNIIHSHIDSLSGIPLSIAFLLGYKVRIAHSHSSSEEKNIKYPIKKLLRKIVSLSSTHNVACTYDSGRVLFGSNNDFKIIPNGIDTSNFSFSMKKRTFIRNKFDLRNKFVIGHVGRFNSMKNQTFLIEVLAKATRINQNIILFLIGDGPLVEVVKEKVIKMRLESYVIFHQSTDHIERFYSAFDLFMFPSVFEGMPLALLEAQASNLICIISDKISTEAICSSQTKSLPIDKGTDEWVDSINILDYDRLTISRELSEFLIKIDVQSTSIKFRELYSIKHG